MLLLGIKPLYVGLTVRGLVTMPTELPQLGYSDIAVESFNSYCAQVQILCMSNFLSVTPTISIVTMFVIVNLQTQFMNTYTMYLLTNSH
jgi:hypothetical protein